LVRRRNRRLQGTVLRWQARLDADWADRVVPWAVAGFLFVVYAAAALARADTLGAGTGLGRHLQAAWAIREGRSPSVTIGGTGNLLADGAPFGFLPLAALTRVLPPIPTLLGAQAAALALGVVPVWRIARRVTNLRVGPASALVLAYACHPLTGALDLADFEPSAMAVTPLLLAAYYAHRKKWWPMALAGAAAVVWASELGLVVAGLGVLLVLEGERRHGARSIVAGLAYTVVVMVVVQAPLGPTGLLQPGAFTSYGDSGLDVLTAMLRNPLRPLAALAAEDNIRFLVSAFAPLAFISVLAPRQLVPVALLQALVFVSDVPLAGGDGAGHSAALLAFAFVAAAFGVAGLGRRRVQRVIVDPGILTIQVIAAAAALLLLSPLSPYAAPIARPVPTSADDALRAATDRVSTDLAVRVPERGLPLVAERAVAFGPEPGPFAADAATADVDAVIVDERSAIEVTNADRLAQRRAVEAEGFRLVSRIAGVSLFVRAQLPSDQLEPSGDG
jgi:hypothetical protein